MSISDIGMIDWANHREIKGDMFTGYWYSTVTNWRDPQNKEIRIIKEVLLAMKCFMLKLLSGSNKFEEDNERMDIIGQNGNDGLHYDIEEPDVEPREENDPQRPTLKGGVKINWF